MEIKGDIESDQTVGPNILHKAEFESLSITVNLFGLPGYDLSVLCDRVSHISIDASGGNSRQGVRPRLPGLD